MLRNFQQVLLQWLRNSEPSKSRTWLLERILVGRASVRCKNVISALIAGLQSLFGGVLSEVMLMVPNVTTLHRNCCQFAEMQKSDVSRDIKVRTLKL